MHTLNHNKMANRGKNESNYTFNLCFDKMLYIIHRDVIKYLISKNNYIAKQSIELLNILKEKEGD